MESGEKIIYLDNAATTRCGEEAARCVYEMLRTGYGNPSSLHRMGFEAERRLTLAAAQVAQCLGCKPEELVFTSGATEANNLAILGGARARRRRGNGVVGTLAEHSSVLGALGALEKEGFGVSLAAPGKDGRIDPQALAALVGPQTVLVSCMLVNNETGAVNDIPAAAAAVRKKNPEALFHCDAVQGLGKLPVSLRRLPVDLLTVSGHKIYGPKGVGALFARRGVRLLPLVYGGGQQRGLRPGTENAAYIAAFGLACEQATRMREERWSHAARLNALLRENVVKIPGACINSPDDATPYILNVSFEGLRSETMLHFLESRGIYVSSGSACTKGARSHVLEAMGLSRARVDSALRLSFSHENTEEEIPAVIDALREGAAVLARART